MHPVTPSVHLVGVPKLSMPAVQDYLAAVGAKKYRVTAEDAAGALIELGGKLCYKAWEPGLNPNVTKTRSDHYEYIANVLKQAHGSVLEHAQFCFIFQNVSRVFTHELVRHRVGVAISQESLRYVRLTELGFWTPSILKEHDRRMVICPDCGQMTPLCVDDIKWEKDGDEPWELAKNGCTNVECNLDHTEVDTYSLRRELDPAGPALPWKYNFETISGVEIMEQHIEACEQVQQDLAVVYNVDKKDFHTKKLLTSAFRRGAPDGLATGLMWSANIRTLRHCILMRTSRYAEEEIRIVFNEVAQIMKRVAPSAFQDLGSRVVDGLPEWYSTNAANPYDAATLEEANKTIADLRAQLEAAQAKAPNFSDDLIQDPFTGEVLNPGINDEPPPSN